MKKLLLLSTLIIFYSIVYSNTCCNQLLDLSFSSTEVEMPPNDLIVHYSFTHHEDSIVTVDSIWYYFTNNEGLSVSENTLETGTLGGEQPFEEQLYIAFNPENTPYFLQELKMYIKVNGRVEMSVVNLFFTPWNTIKVYSQGDLPQYFKHWQVASSNSAEPIKHEINPDTLPEPPDTTLPICWRSIPGLAYNVAVNCDTTTPTTEQYTTFKGTAVGRIEFPYTNQINVVRNLPIAFAKVEVLCNGNVAAGGQTDANGNYSIYYEYKSWFNTSGNVSVSIKVTSKDNDNNSLEIKARIPNTPSYGLVSISTTGKTHNINNNHATFNFGTVQAPFISFLSIYHWARRSLDFAKTELGNSNAFINWKPLQFHVDNTTSSPNQCNYSSINSNSKLIRLGRMNCIAFETTTYHEMGHYVQFMIQNDKRQPGAGGTHTEVHNNTHPNQTITEGFATAFGMMVDARYHLDDQESFRAGFGRLAHPRASLLAITHPFTAEAVFANSLLDLWDDVNKLNNYGLQLTPDRIDDINDLEFGQNQDEVSLPFEQIIFPFLYNRSSNAATVQDVLQYYGYLHGILNNCQLQGKIKRMIDFNFRNPNYTGANVISGANFRINSDFIGQPAPVINHRNDDIIVVNGFPNYGPNPFNYSYSYSNSIDLSDESFTTNTGSFNSALGINVPSQDISDDLTLSDNTILYFNNNIPVGWVNDNTSVRPPANSKLISNICGASITVESGSSIIVGDAVVNTTAEVTVGGGAEIVLTSGSELRVNNNSKLIIDNDASFVFEDGANIVLTGDNAVLEIGGQLLIGDNTEFTFSGDGFIRTNFYPCLNCDNIIIGNNSTIKLEGNNKQDKILEVASGSHFEPGDMEGVFTLFNGKVEMGEGSILHLRKSIADFRQLNITASNSGNSFYGLMLNGKNAHTYSDLDISNASYGFHDRQIYGGSKLRLDNVNITNCYVGIRADGRGIDLNNCTLDANQTGIQLDNSAFGFKSKLANTSVVNCQLAAIEHISAGGDLELTDSHLDDNLDGILFSGSGTLSGNCSSIKNNTSTGVFIENLGIIDFDNISRVEIADNYYSIFTVNTRALMLDNGRNNLKALIANQLNIMLGTVQYLSPIHGAQNIQANRNNWQFPNTAPIYNTDYLLEAEYITPGNNTLYPAYLIDNNPTLPDQLQCNQVSSNPCSNLPCLQSSPVINCPDCPVINTPNFNNVTLNDALLLVLNNLSASNPLYLDEIEKLEEILTISVVEPDNDVRYVLAYAYKTMKEVYAEAIENGLINTAIEENSPVINEYANKLIQIMDQRTTSIYYNTEQSYNEKIYHLIDQALLYRGIKRYDLALIKIAEGVTTAAGKDLEYLNYLNCTFSVEADLLNGIISFEEFENQSANCTLPDPRPDMIQAYQSEAEGEEDAFQTSVFPNPNTGNFTITAENFSGESLNVKVFNAGTQLVYETDLTAQNNFVSHQINLSGLPNGVFNIHFTSIDAVVVKQVIINQ